MLGGIRELFIPLDNRRAVRILMIVGLVVYFNSLFNGFAWDDINFILENNEIHSVDLSVIFGPSKFNTLGYYRALPALYFSVLYSLFERNAFFYHGIQILIHITNSVLIYFLFGRFFKNYISLALSTIFLVHPIQVESVSYISSSGGALFFLSGISAFTLVLKNAVKRNNIIVIALLLLLSLLSKEAAILFFISIFSYCLLFERYKLIPFSIAGSAAVIIYSLLRFLVGGIYFGNQSNVPIAHLTFSEKLLNSPSVAAYYLKTFIFPHNLSISQRWIVTEVNFAQFYLPVFIVLFFVSAIFVLGLIVYRHKIKLYKAFILFLIWTVSGFILLLPIFPLDMTVAERWFYYPIVGLLGLFGVFLQIIVDSNRRKDIIYTLIILVIIVITLFSIRTVDRNADWKDNFTLYSNDTKIQTNWSMESDLGLAFAEKGDYGNALDHLHRSIEMNNCDLSLYNLGYVYELKGNSDKAINYYKKSVDAKNCKEYTIKHKVTKQINNQEILYIRLGRLLIVGEQYEDAKKYLEIGLIEYPNSGILWSFMAVSEYNQNNVEIATIAAQRAVKLLPHEYTKYIYSQIINKKPIDFLKFFNN